MTPEILLYNFQEDDRFRQIRRFLNRAKVNVRIVHTPEFLQPLGALFEIPGFPRNTLFNFNGNFTEEMLVMKDFSDTLMDDFLDFFKDTQLAPVELKAVLTPVTQHWNSLQLFQALKKEHDAMNL